MRLEWRQSAGAAQVIVFPLFSGLSIYLFISKYTYQRAGVKPWPPIHSLLLPRCCDSSSQPDERRASKEHTVAHTHTHTHGRQQRWLIWKSLSACFVSGIATCESCSSFDILPHKHSVWCQKAARRRDSKEQTTQSAHVYLEQASSQMAFLKSHCCACILYMCPLMISRTKLISPRCNILF